MAEGYRPVVRHGDREITRILQRAAELQEQDRQRGAGAMERAGGLSLEELKQVAAEVGIDPRYVEAAASEVADTGRSRRRFFFWGAPRATELEQVVEGEVTEAEWDTLLAAIRRSVGQTGNSSRLGQTLEWNGAMDHVSVSPRDGQTRIRILSQHFTRVFPIHFNVGILSFLLIILISILPNVSLLEGVALWAAGTGMLFGAARGLVSGVCGRQTARMKELLRELAAHVEQSVPRVAEETAGAVTGVENGAAAPPRRQAEPPSQDQEIRLKR